MSVYLDYNASTPINKIVLQVMVEAYSLYYGNSSSLHKEGFEAFRALENARSKIGKFLNRSAFSVIFTSGATESNNLAIMGLARYGLQHNKRHIIASAIEHKSVKTPLKILEQQGFIVDYINPETNGSISVSKILNLLRPDTLLVSLMHINNETGVIQPTQEIGKKLKKTNTFFHVDAAQSCGKLIDEVKTMEYDLLSFTAHKLYGPQGIGALVIGDGNLELNPIMFGGDQEMGYRPGTVPVSLAVGFAKACEILESEHENNYKIYLENQKLMLNCLNEASVEYNVNGDFNLIYPTTLNISLKGIDAQKFMENCKEFSFSVGSACNCNVKSGSYVLLEMGLPAERLNSAIRLSWGNQLLEKEKLYKFAKVIKELQSKV